jgi:hypothetical protein
LAGCDTCTASNRLCRQAINAWLIRNSAFVSEQQARPNAVNSPINIGEATRPAYRPPGYGRAVIVPIDSPAKEGEAGFLDLKGAGVAPGRTPSHASHSSGLEYLGFALADFFYGWLIDTIFARTFPGYHVLPVYAVLDLGFDITGDWHGTAPAGLHVRRAHARPVPRECLPMSGSDREKLMLHVELLLRTFGLSTTGPGTAFELADPDGGDALVYDGAPVDPETDLERQKAARIAEAIRASGGSRLEVTNVQLTSEGDWSDKTLELLDFGGLSANRYFTHPLANLIRNGALNVGRILLPQDPAFATPDESVAVDPNLCNRHSVNAYGFYAAERFRHDSAGSFGQGRVEVIMRIARLKALRRNFDWACRRVFTARGAA